MGKTYKKRPSGVFRGPKGNKNARINDARKKSIPPNPHEDIPFDNQCWNADRAVERMRVRGLSEEQMINKIKRKFNLTHQEAREVVEIN